MSDKTPKKYLDAYELIKKKDEDGFLDFEAKNNLDYEVHTLTGNYGDKGKTLLDLACDKRLWRCAARIMEKGGKATWECVAQSYGRAPADLAEKIWKSFAKHTSILAPVKFCHSNEFDTPLLAAFIRSRCHTSLIKKLVEELKLSPKVKMHFECNDSDFSVASALLRAENLLYLWNPEAFVWLCSKFSKAQLGITDEDIGRILYGWKEGEYSYILDGEQEINGDIKDDPDLAERVFWMLEKMHNNKKLFADYAALLMPRKIEHDGDRRLVKMLAACGVSAIVAPPEFYEAAREFEKQVECSHCSGTGKVKGVDLELAQAAKKRRFEAVEKK